MFCYTRKLKSLDDLIITQNARNYYRLRGKDLKGLTLDRALGQGIVAKKDGYFEDISFHQVWCKEHRRPELVSKHNFRRDLWMWYHPVGRHPRFSIAGALAKAKQRHQEIEYLMDVTGILPGILQKARTQEEFLKSVRPHLFATLRVGRRTYRVSSRFKEMYEQKSFKIGDFFREASQELRRLMIRVLPIREITRRLKLVARDGEGILYDYRRSRLPPSRYLYVRCPSTGQDYLLEVPVDIRKPKDARRWTFNLDPKTKFAKEA